MFKVKPHIETLAPFKPGMSLEEYQRRHSLRKMVKLASNENPIGMSNFAIEAMKAQIDKLHFYPDPNATCLKEAIAKRYHLSEKKIIVGCGSENILMLSALAVLEKGDNVIVSDYTFPTYLLIAQKCGAEVTSVPTIQWGHDLDGMLSKVKKKTKIIFLDNPRNPTGTVLQYTEIQHFLSVLRKDILVVLDEAYLEYSPSLSWRHTNELLVQHQNLVVTRTFSKIYAMASLRVGYGISSEYFVSKLTSLRMPFPETRISQYAAAEALFDEEHITKSLYNNSQGKGVLYQFFDDLNLTYIPSETNFVTFDIGQSSVGLCEDLLQSGLILRELSSFGMPNSVRMTVGDAEQLSYAIPLIKEKITKYLDRSVK